MSTYPTTPYRNGERSTVPSRGRGSGYQGTDPSNALRTVLGGPSAHALAGDPAPYMRAIAQLLPHPHELAVAAPLARRIPTRLLRGVPYVGAAFTLYALYETYTEIPGGTVTTGNPPDREKSGWTLSYHGWDDADHVYANPADVRYTAPSGPTKDDWSLGYYRRDDLWDVTRYGTMNAYTEYYDSYTTGNFRWRVIEAWYAEWYARSDPTEWVYPEDTIVTTTSPVMVPMLQPFVPTRRVGDAYPDYWLTERGYGEPLRSDSDTLSTEMKRTVITETKINRDLSQHEPAPAKRGEKERKVIANLRNGSAIGKIFGTVTEATDFIDAFYDALDNQYKPEAWKRRYWDKEAKKWVTKWVTSSRHVSESGKVTFYKRNPTPTKKLETLYKNWDKVDMNKAIENVALNQLEDMLIGKFGSAAQKAAKPQLEQLKRPVGFGTGLAF